MICLAKNKQGAEILMDYCAGTLAAEATITVDDHALKCPDCQRLISAQREVWQALDQFAAPEVSTHFDQRLYARIARERERPVWRRLLTRAFGPWEMPVSKPALAGAAACAALAIGLVLHVPGAQVNGSGAAATVSDEQGKQSRVDRIDIEQVEQTLQDLELLAPQTPSSAM